MSVQIRVARTPAEYDALFCLRYQVYVETEGRFSPDQFPDRQIMDRFDTFDGTTNLLAYHRDQLVGFVRISEDGPLGLPVEDHYDLGPARALCQGRLAGISMLGVDRRYRSLETGLALSHATASFLRARGVDDTVAVANCDVEPVYHYFGMSRAADPFFCSRVNQKLVLMHGRADALPAGKIPVTSDYLERPRLLLSKGERLFDRGAPGGTAWLVLSGEVELSVDGVGGGRRILSTAQPGELVGELEQTPTDRRIYTASAKGSCELVEIPASELPLLLRQRVGRLQDLFQSLGRRFQSATTQGEVQPGPGIRLFNDYLSARVFYTLQRMRFFELLGNRDRFELGPMAARMGCRPEHLEPVLHYLKQLGWLTCAGEVWFMPPASRQVLEQELSFVHWLVGAYSPVMDNLEALVNGRLTYGLEVRRDDREVARSSAAISRHYTDPHMYELLRLDGVRTVADIGTGSAQRLIEICGRFPHVRAIGIDLSPDACRVARENVSRAGMEGRIQIVEARGEEWLASRAQAQLEPVDMVMCFAMFHDLLNVEGLAEGFLQGVVSGLRPGAYLMIQDQMKLAEGRSRLDNWGAGFELMHHFMGQRLFLVERYERAFMQAGLRVVRRLETPIPDNWIYVLQVPGPGEPKEP